MALANDITLGNSQDGGTSTFSLIDAANGVRADKSRTLSNPRLLVVKHNKQTEGKKVTDRHLVQFTETDMVNGEASTTTINVSIAMPRSNPNPQTTAKRLMGYVRNLLNESASTADGALYGILVNER